MNAPNRYVGTIFDNTFHCVELNGVETHCFAKQDAAKATPKLYVVIHEDAVLYVGITVRSMTARMRHGFNADGKTGYYGCK